MTKVDFEWVVRAYMEEKLTRYKAYGKIMEAYVRKDFVVLCFALKPGERKFPIIASMVELVKVILLEKTGIRT